jgi:hypothetical protein
MPSGSYRISSALVKKTGDYLDRFASHEAHVEVVPGDNAVIVLTLRPLEDPLARANITDLSSRVGLPSELARSLN